MRGSSRSTRCRSVPTSLYYRFGFRHGDESIIESLLEIRGTRIHGSDAGTGSGERRVRR